MQLDQKIKPLDGNAVDTVKKIHFIDYNENGHRFKKALENRGLKVVNTSSNLHKAFNKKNVMAIVLNAPLRAGTLTRYLYALKTDWRYKDVPKFVMVSQRVDSSLVRELYQMGVKGVFRYDMKTEHVLFSMYKEIFVKPLQQTKNISTNKLLSNMIYEQMMALYEIENLKIRVKKHGQLIIKGIVQNLHDLNNIIDLLSKNPAFTDINFKKLYIKETKINDSIYQKWAKKIVKTFKSFTKHPVNVAVYDHIVYLSGLVRSPQEKEKVEVYMKKLPGIKGVQSEVKVESLTDKFSEKELAEKILSQFNNAKTVDLEFKEDRVIVKGKVRSRNIIQLVNEFVIQNTNSNKIENKMEVA